MNIIDGTLIVAAHRRGHWLGTAWPRPDGENQETRGMQLVACQRFLEAYAPEYARAREWEAISSRKTVLGAMLEAYHGALMRATTELFSAPPRSGCEKGARLRRDKLLEAVDLLRCELANTIVGERPSGLPLHLKKELDARIRGDRPAGSPPSNLWMAV